MKGPEKADFYEFGLTIAIPDATSIPFFHVVLYIRLNQQGDCYSFSSLPC